MTVKPYELLARFNPNGTIAGVTVRTLTTVNGRDFESDPIPLSGATDPAFTQFAQSFSAAIVAERDALQQQANTLAAQVAQLTQENATALARIEELESQLNPPRPAEVTPAQIRVWLVMRGVELAQVDALIASIPDPMQREIARIKWEYGVAVIRTDPLVEQLGIALDLTPEQIDAAFVEASQLWSV